MKWKICLTHVTWMIYFLFCILIYVAKPFPYLTQVCHCLLNKGVLKIWHGLLQLRNIWFIKVWTFSFICLRMKIELIRNPFSWKKCTILWVLRRAGRPVLHNIYCKWYLQIFMQFNPVIRWMTLFWCGSISAATKWVLMPNGLGGRISIYLVFSFDTLKSIPNRFLSFFYFP